jgi:hypothetical protein
MASYDAGIRPLFLERDRRAMLSRLDRSSYDDAKANADAILGQLAAGSMPCHGAWPDERVEFLPALLADGTPA